MDKKSYLEEFYKKYEQPSIGEVIIGFAGIDPSVRVPETGISSACIGMSEVESYVTEQLSGTKAELKGYADGKVSDTDTELKNYADTKAASLKSELEDYVQDQLNDQLSGANIELKSYIDNQTAALEAGLIDELKEYVRQRLEDTENPPTMEELESYITEQVQGALSSCSLELKGHVDSELETLKSSVMTELKDYADEKIAALSETLEQEIEASRIGALSDMKIYLGQTGTTLDCGEIGNG